MNLFLKRLIAFSLSFGIMIFLFAVPAGAEDSAQDKPIVSQGDIFIEKILGGLGSVFGKVLNAITFTDESRIEKAPARRAAGVEHKGDLFSGAPEQTLSAETWRVVEITYESEKEYADPFDELF